MSIKELREKRISDIVFSRVPVTASRATSLREGIRLLNEHDIGSLVVMDGERVAGIFTERDFLRKVAGHPVDLDQATLNEFMTPSPVCQTVDTPVLSALVRMRMGSFRHLIVCDPSGRMVGVISIRDLAAFLLDSHTD